MVAIDGGGLFFVLVKKTLFGWAASGDVGMVIVVVFMVKSGGWRGGEEWLMWRVVSVWRMIKIKENKIR